MGASAATKSRQMLPAVRTSYVDVPLRDGNIDFTDANEYGRAFYEKRTFTMNLLIKAEDIIELQNKISDTARWLSGRGELIFDDMPLAIWDASAVNGIDFAPELSGTRAIITVNFETEPFARGAVDVARGVLLGDDILLGSRVPIGLDEKMTQSFTGANGSLVFVNAGTAYARPVITISGNRQIGYSTISCGGKSLIIQGITDSRAVVDMENFKLLAGTEETDKTGILGGSFFELAPGENTLEFAMQNSTTYTVSVSYVPRFVYNADYSIGGDADA